MKRRSSREGLRKFRDNHPMAFGMLCHVLMAFGRSYMLLFSTIVPVFSAIMASLFAWSFIQFEYKLDLLLAFFFSVITIATLDPFLRLYFRLRKVFIRGTRLEEKSHPELHSVFRDLTTDLSSPGITRISIIPDSEISISTPIRPGRLQENWITIGIIIFLTFTRREFEALMAHEVGHLCGPRNRASRQMMQRVYTLTLLGDELMHRNQFCALIAQPIRRTILPPLTSLSEATEWDNEWESDLVSANLYGRRVFARSFLRLEVIQVMREYLFWEKVFRSDQPNHSPPRNIYHQLQDFIFEDSTQSDWTAAARWAMMFPARPGSRHPATADRMSRIGVASEDIEQLALQIFETRKPAESAAHLLATDAGQLTDLFSRSWATEKQEVWSAWIDARNQRHITFDMLSKKRETEGLDESEGIDWLLTRSELEGIESVLEDWFEFLKTHPRNEIALEKVGTELCQRDDHHGLWYLEQLAQTATMNRLAACWKLVSHRERFGENTPAKMNEVQDLIREWQMARHEIENFSPHGSFEPLELSRLYQYSAKELIKQFMDCKAAWVLRFRPETLPDYPCTILFLRVGLFQQIDDDLLDHLRLNLPFPNIQPPVVFRSRVAIRPWWKALSQKGARIL